MVKKATLPKKVKSDVKDYIKILEKDKLPIDKVIVFGSQTKKNKPPRKRHRRLCYFSKIQR